MNNLYTVREYLESQGFVYDHIKKMYYMSRSGCHNAKTITAYKLDGKKILDTSILSSKHIRELVYYEVCEVCKKSTKLNSTFLSE